MSILSQDFDILKINIPSDMSKRFMGFTSKLFIAQKLANANYGCALYHAITYFGKVNGNIVKWKKSNDIIEQ
jgi:hypothetical protein